MRPASNRSLALSQQRTGPVGLFLFSSETAFFFLDFFSTVSSRGKRRILVFGVAVDRYFLVRSLSIVKNDGKRAFLFEIGSHFLTNEVMSLQALTSIYLEALYIDISWYGRCQSLKTMGKGPSFSKLAHIFLNNEVMSLPPEPDQCSVYVQWR